MERIEEFPEKISRGRKPKYDYDKLTDGNVWVLKRGVDFDRSAETRNIASYLTSKVRERGLKARYRILDKDTVVFQTMRAGR